MKKNILYSATFYNELYDSLNRIVNIIYQTKSIRADTDALYIGWYVVLPLVSSGLAYCVSKKACPFLHSNSLYKYGKDF